MRSRIALIFLFTLTAASVSAQSFNALALKGSFAFGFQGLESGMRVVSTGVMLLDGVGAVTGKASIRRDGGGNCEFTIRNSVYRVNADGTGFFALGFFGDAPCTTSSLAVHFTIAAESVDRFELASAQGTFEGSATRQIAGAFTTANVAGTYAFRFSGLDGFTPTVATGVMTLDGKGMVTGRASIKKEGGGSCIGTIRNSTYGVVANGTGFMALGFFPDPGCGFAEAWPLSIAVSGPKRGIELASSSNSLFAGSARSQVTP